MKTLLVVFVSIFSVSYSVPLPFKKCERKQADFNDCLSSAINDAIHQLKSAKPEVALPSLEPFVIPEISIGAGTKAVTFNQNYKNVKITGFSEPKSVKANMDFDKKTLVMDLEFSEVRMDFDYDVNGNIMMMPISGQGPGFIALGSLKINLNFVLEEYDKKGKKHFKVSDSTLVFSDLANPKVNFENLFNGDKTLGDNINKMINENWNDLFADVKSGYENGAAVTFKAIFNGFLAKVSVSELFGDA